MVPARDQTHDLDVQYSKINHDLIVGDDKHKVQVTENNNGKTMCMYNYCIIDSVMYL